jgi:hypothetical protein
MAIQLADRVRETTTTTGTGAISLGGAVAGYQAFSVVFLTGAVCYYAITDGVNWEIGYGALTSGTPWTLARTTILASSNANAAVSFGAGTKDIFCTAPAVALSSTPRVGSAASSATPTIDTDAVDVYRLTAQAVDVTSFSTNLSGTPAHDQALLIEITGTAARALAWGASFESSTIALPTTTVGVAMLQVAFMWNSATNKWRCIGIV